MAKLKGKTYLSYWDTRAKVNGPRYVSGYDNHTPKLHDSQAEMFMEIIGPALPEGVETLLEYGCGPGRMLHRFQARYPDARCTGVDIVEQAILWGRERHPDLNFVRSDGIPADVPRSDLIITCTCLQHITDPGSWERCINTISQNAKPGAYLVMLESCKITGVEHMADRSPATIIAAFDKFEFGEPTHFEHVPAHLFVGVRKENP